MKTINVSFEQLTMCANRMDEHNDEYLRNVSILFETVSEMAEAWKGKDNRAFTDKINSFQSDFREISLLCEQYSEFLRNSANSYANTQDELMSYASGIGR